MTDHSRQHPVLFVGAGPGDPELLTLAALRALAEAEVVLHDRLVSAEILDFAPGAELVSVGKEGFGHAMPQAEISALIVAHALAGRKVVRLKAGDCGIFGRLDEELEAVLAEGLAYRVIPGITASVAAAAAVGQSLTRRGRNSELRVITGHDIAGYAEQDWRSLALPGAVAAIYMGKRAARFTQGRLLMHGALPETPVTIVENVSRADQRVVPGTLATLLRCLEEVAGPAVILLGLAPRQAAAAAETAIAELKEALT